MSFCEIIIFSVPQNISADSSDWAAQNCSWKVEWNIHCQMKILNLPMKWQWRNRQFSDVRNVCFMIQDGMSKRSVTKWILQSVSSTRVLRFDPDPRRLMIWSDVSEDCDSSTVNGLRSLHEFTYLYNTPPRELLRKLISSRDVPRSARNTISNFQKRGKFNVCAVSFKSQ